MKIQMQVKDIIADKQRLAYLEKCTTFNLKYWSDPKAWVIIDETDFKNWVDKKSKGLDRPILNLTEEKINNIEEYIEKLFVKLENYDYHYLSDAYKDIGESLMGIMFDEDIEEFLLQLCDR